MKSLEERLAENTEALRENTAALIALRTEGGSAPAASAAAPVDDLDDPPAATVPAKKAAKKAAKEAPAPAANGKDLEYLRTFIKNERERLKTEVSVEAVAAHKTAFGKILDKFGVSSLSEVKPEDVPKLIAEVEAIDLSGGADSDDDDLG